VAPSRAKFELGLIGVCAFVGVAAFMGSLIGERVAGEWGGVAGVAVVMVPVVAVALVVRRRGSQQ
jgi:hypothetical protein